MASNPGFRSLKTLDYVIISPCGPRRLCLSAHNGCVSRNATKRFFARPHLLAGSKRPCDRSAAVAAADEENAMKQTVIRYRTKPEMADTNAELVAAVFAELKAAQPQGLRYMSLRLEDDTFI